MCKLPHPRFVVSPIGLLLIAPYWFGAAIAQVSEPASSWKGEVTGNDVYVRSGPSSNHYPVCKLGAGDRVTVVGEKSGWFEILPVEGTFSLISGDYVDTPDDEAGVINGNNVRVRAGSSLSKEKYVVQTMLSKGAEVSILGRNPDGFLRIASPQGVTLWINTDYVERVPDARLKSESASNASPGPGDKTAGMGEAATGSGTAAVSSAARGALMTQKRRRSASLLAALPMTKERRSLGRVDADVEAELAKPLLERQFQPLIERYRGITEQEEDEFARRYALARIEQIDDMIEASETVRRVRKLNEEAEAKRRDFMAARASMHGTPLPTPSGLDAQGELHVSALYPPGSSYPKRYRLVDPVIPPGRTIAYVDIPLDLNVDVNEFVGRYVGVRASKKRLQAGGVDPVPIYVARELVLLQPTPATDESTSPD